MAIDSRQIDTDITLELDEEELTYPEFQASLEHFAGLVREVTKAITPNRKPTWLIKIYPGSAGIGFYPKVGVFTSDELSHVRNAVLSGIEILDKGQRPVHYSDKAIQHARAIRHAFRGRQRPARVRIWSGNERSVPLKQEIEDTAKKILDPVFEDDGSIEGTLEVLSGHGKYEVVLYDPIDGRAVTCEVGTEQMKVALDSFMHRVEVFGKVRYRRDGLAVSVKVEQIIPFPLRDQIPSLESVRGVLKD